MDLLPHDLHPAARLEWRITHLRCIASCQRRDIRESLSSAARRKARLALAETLRNLRILVHP